MNSKIIPVAGLIVFIGLLFAFQQKTPPEDAQIKKGMTKVTILYPNGEGKTFDVDYYKNKHMPMVAGFLGENLEFYEIDKGIAGRAPTDKPPYLAVGYFYIKDVAEYNNAIGQNREVIINDIKNYTNIQPVIQISEVSQLGFNNPK
jgi:uncharacterized protein (TIGR02118 family)